MCEREKEFSLRIFHYYKAEHQDIKSNEEKPLLSLSEKFVYFYIFLWFIVSLRKIFCDYNEVLTRFSFNFMAFPQN